MKKIGYVFLIVFILIVAIYSIKIIKTQSKIKSINSELSKGTFDFIFMNYFDNYGEFPSNLEQGINSYLNGLNIPNTEIEESNLKRIFNDPFCECFLTYIPLKDTLTNRYLGFLLLSKGPDKEINNSKNFLYLNNFKNNLKLSNKHLEKIYNKSYQGIYISFHKAIICAKSDVLVFYMSIPDYYRTIIVINNNNPEKDLKYYIERYKSELEKGNFRPLAKRYISQSLSNDNFKIEKNSIVTTYYGYNVTYQMISTKEMNMDTLQNTIIVGKLDKIDFNSNKIILKNCLPLQFNQN